MGMGQIARQIGVSRELPLLRVVTLCRPDPSHIAASIRMISRPSPIGRASLIVTTNLPFGEWTNVFPDARLAKPVVDRLTHAHIIDTGNESWRFRHGLANPED